MSLLGKPYVKPPKTLTSIMKTDVTKNKMSYNRIIKDVKNAMPEEGVKSRTKMAKFVKKMADNPESIKFNKKTKAAIDVLGKTGHLKPKYEKYQRMAFKEMQKVDRLEKDNEGGIEEKSEFELTAMEKQELAKQELAKKKKMWAKARMDRRRAEDEETVTRSLGLEDWQAAHTSVGGAVKEKEEERRKLQEKKDSDFLDMVID